MLWSAIGDPPFLPNPCNHFPQEEDKEEEGNPTLAPHSVKNSNMGRRCKAYIETEASNLGRWMPNVYIGEVGQIEVYLLIIFC